MTAPAVPAKKGRKSPAKSPDVPMVRQPHGGALRVGGTNAGGPGRPRDEVRARLLELGANKSVPFLAELMEGKIRVDLIGVCAQCKAETQMDATWLEEFVDKYRASADLRLKATEQAFKYGLGTQREEQSSDIMRHPDAGRFLAAIHAAVETALRLHAPAQADRVLSAIERELAQRSAA